MRGALVRDGLVENVVEYDDGWQPDDGTELVPVKLGDYVSPGFGYDGENWLPPDVEAPGEPEPTPLEQVRADLDWLINYVVTGEG